MVGGQGLGPVAVLGEGFPAVGNEAGGFGAAVEVGAGIGHDGVEVGDLIAFTKMGGGQFRIGVMTPTGVGAASKPLRQIR